ncbi:hypothetical protein BpHYR1_010315 [Brachionus plicatilis]|uniref:Uncharacterized protein n=1 Tax=Brachionus plicatilis TaxID=10195 RepID=A0A3M7QHQ6_BRAPC|nr:hypothetical protein BpHYR1_010315 [Brachionus plicatilis]
MILKIQHKIFFIIEHFVTIIIGLLFCQFIYINFVILLFSHCYKTCSLIKKRWLLGCEKINNLNLDKASSMRQTVTELSIGDFRSGKNASLMSKLVVHDGP